MTNTKKIFEIAQQKGIDETKIVWSMTKSSKLKWENNKIETVSKDELVSTTLSGIINGNEASVSIVGPLEDKIEIVVEFLKQAIANRTKEADASYTSPEGLSYLSFDKKTFVPLENAQAIVLIDSLGQAINASNEAIIKQNTIVQYYYAFNHSGNANSKGLDLEQEKGSVFWVVAIVFVAKVPDNATVFFVKAYQDIKDYDEKAFVAKVNKQVKLKLEKQDFENKDYEIVFAPSVFNDLFSQFYSHFNARSVIDKRSVWETKLNTQVASEKITLIDTPIVPEMGEYLTYDKDGMPTRENTIIDKGVLKSFIHNVTTAKIMNTTSTGNSAGLAPAVHFIYIKNGEIAEEELLNTVKEGIYITDLKGFHSGVNVNSGDFSLEVEGNMIVDGKIKKAIKTGIISGNFFNDVLINIDLVANNNDFSENKNSPTIKLSKKLPITR